MQHISLPEDYSLVLQEVSENGEEDFAELAETLNFERSRLQHIIQSLEHYTWAWSLDTAERERPKIHPIALA
jgi:DNA-binding IclR family transcriptional regulator